MLERLDMTNGKFNLLEGQWKEQCEALGEDYSDFWSVFMEHARSVASENPQDKKYGVFGLKEGEEFVSLCHVNWANLPRTQGTTIRVVWVILAPRYDFASQPEVDTSNIAASLIFGAVNLAKSAPVAQNIKIHCGNVVDRQYFVGIASALRELHSFTEADVKGNWLHITI